MRQRKLSPVNKEKNQLESCLTHFREGKMRSRSLGLTIGIFVLSSCVAGCASQPTTTSETARLMIYPRGAKVTEFPFIPAGLSKDHPTDGSFEFLRERDESNRVAEICGTDTGTARALPLASVVGWGLGQLAKWGIEQISAKLDAAVKAHSIRVPIESESFDFYRYLDVTGQPQKGELCFRVARTDHADPNDKSTPLILLMDFVGRIRYTDETPEVLTISPVRLFYHRTLVKNSDGAVAVNIMLSADVIHRAELRSLTSPSAIDTSIVSEAFHVDENGYISGEQEAQDGVSRHASVQQQYLYVTYPDQETTAKRPIKKEVPLPPWNLSYPAADNELKANRMKATIVVTEVGNIPWLLKNAADLLEKNKDGVVSDLADRAKELADDKFK